MRIVTNILLIISMLILFSCVKTKENSTSEKRIITLSPSLTETVFLLGKGNDIVGVSDYCNYPERAKQIPIVANVSSLFLESIVTLKPDIVFLLPFQEHYADKLTLLNIRSKVINQNGLTDILNSIIEIGKEIDTNDRAEFVYDSLKSIMDSAVQPSQRLTALISLDREYGTKVTSCYSTGRNSFISDIVTISGFDNCLETDIPYPKIGAEAMLSLDPDIIIELVPGNVLLNEEELKSDWQDLSSMRSVDNKRIYIFKGSYLTIPGPRVFSLITELNNYSESFTNINP